MIRYIYLSCIVLFAVSPLLSQPTLQQTTQQEKRLALVIGNGNYSIGILANPENDAKAMNDVLQQLGFTVYKYENLSQEKMKRAIDDFGNMLKGNDVGLFFYAGHGIQTKGYNYLIPIDAQLQIEADVEYDCVQADRILAKMENSGSKVNIIILDACRNNPFERSWTRSETGKGLAFMNAPSGTLIAYSTSPGSTALDGSGKNSPYTSAILESIVIPKITITQLFQNVGRILSDKTGKQQIPWIASSLIGDFYFSTTDNAEEQKNLPKKYEDNSNEHINSFKTTSRDIFITDIFKLPSLNNKDSSIFVKINQGLNSKIKKNSILNLYSANFIPQNEATNSILKKRDYLIGHTNISKVDSDSSIGKVKFKSYYNQNNFIYDSTYVKPKLIFSTLCITYAYNFNHKEFYINSLFDLRYMVTSRWIGGYVGCGTMSKTDASSESGIMIHSRNFLLSAGFIIPISNSTSISAGADFNFDWGIIDLLINSRIKNISLLYGLSYGIDSYVFGLNPKIGVGVTF